MSFSLIPTSLLYRKARRDIRSMGVRALFVTISLAVGVAVYVGGIAAHDSLVFTRDDYFERLKLSDVQATLSPPADLSELPDLNAIPGVARAERRFGQLSTVEKRDGLPLSVAIIHFDTGVIPEINKVEVIEGRFMDPAKGNEVVIEKTMRDLLGYKVGDKLVLDPYMNPQELVIVGVGVSPEFLLPTANPDVLLPAKGSLGVLFRYNNHLKETFGEPWYNDLTFLAKPGVSRAELTANIKAALRTVPKVEIDRLIPREQQFGYRYLQEDLKGLGIFLPVIASLFAFVTGIVLLLSINRLVITQEREIGALLAQGFTMRRIATSFVYMAVAIATAGTALGLLLAPYIRNSFAENYARTVGLPEPKMLIVWQEPLIAYAGAVVLCILFSLLPLLRLTAWQPSQLVRGVTEENFALPSAALQGIAAKFAGTSNTRRHAIRNLIRRPRLTFAVVMLIALAGSLATAMRVSQMAWVHYAKNAFAGEKWDAIVAFRVPLAQRDIDPILKNTPQVHDQRRIVFGSGIIVDGDARSQYRLIGIEYAKPSRYLRYLEGGFFSGENEPEIIINANFSSGHKYHVGQTVHVESNRGTQYPVKVVGITNDMTMGVAYMPIGFARKVLDRANDDTGMFLYINGDPHAAKKALFQNEMVQYVSLKADMEKQTWEYLKVMFALVTVALVISVAMALMFMLTGLSLTVLEREGEYASLRAIGFSNPTVASIIFWEVLAQGVLAVIAAVPLTWVLCQYLEYQFSRAWMKISFVYEWDVMLMTALPIFLFLPLAALPGVRQILTLDLAQTLRRRSLG